ncbi:MAG TPA: penicillin-binding protein 2 [Candidatus Limnocylindria bacterium]
MTELNGDLDDLPRSGRRFAAFGVVAALLLAVLVVRLFQVQVVDGAVYAARVAADRTVELAVPAPRGLIFDRAGRPVAVNAPAWTVSIRPGDLPQTQRARVLALLADLTGAEVGAIEERLDGYAGSPLDLLPVVRGLTRETALLVAERAPQLPGVVIEVDPRREYLDEAGSVGGELMAHVIGYTGRVEADELARLQPLGYLHDDFVGRAGVEASFEAELRGDYGSQLAERDAKGRVVQVLETVRQPRPGTNLMLTIDAQTQRLATQALTWGMEVAGVSQGVTIVMNPQNGEILAMVSLPTYDANAFASGISAADFEMYLEDPNLPLRNHAISDIYPPGSTYKLVTSIAALEEGITTPDQQWPTYACFQIPGAPEGECLFDWNRQGFGPLDIVDAFAKSSDTFYYQLAIEAGIDRLAAWAGELGFGQLSGIRLPGEEAGIIASTDWARRQGRSGVFTGELAQAGIGQNVIAVTPLQLLNAYAAVANGGRLMEPQVVLGETDASGALIRRYEPRPIRTLDVDASTLHTMRVAAREVIASGHAYNIRDLALPGALSGKTGTAEFGELTAEGTLPFHSWFVAYLPSVDGATDAELAVVTFTYAAVVPGNVSAEVVKYFLQLHYGLGQDLRLDPNDFSLVTAN